MRLKQRPEDFSVIESYRFTKVKDGDYFVYRMDKQKVSTLYSHPTWMSYIPRFHPPRRSTYKA